MLVATETTDLLLCVLADERYALPMRVVREVIRWSAPTPVPGTPPTLLGVIHHRGAVLPIIDIRPLLQLSRLSITRNTRLIVVEHDGLSAGIIGDQVADIVEVERAAIEAPPPSLPAAQAQFVTGLTSYDAQPVALLNPAALFAAITSSRHAG
jgi:purine-binding chemotaxis protein CheW